MKTEALEELAD